MSHSNNDWLSRISLNPFTDMGYIFIGSLPNYWVPNRFQISTRVHRIVFFSLKFKLGSDIINHVMAQLFNQFLLHHYVNLFIYYFFQTEDGRSYPENI